MTNDVIGAKQLLKGAADNQMKRHPGLQLKSAMIEWRLVNAKLAMPASMD